MVKNTHEVLTSTKGTLRFRKQGNSVVGFNQEGGLSGKPLDLSKEISFVNNEIILRSNFPETNDNPSTDKSKEN